MRPPRLPPVRPDAASLHEAALDYLARYSATAATLRRVLQRRVQRWARAAAETGEEGIEAARAPLAAAIEAEIARMVALGAVNDAEFAASRARSLSRSGRSARFIAAHLAARGVTGATLRDVLPGSDEEGSRTELAAALALARRRRIGPFRPADKPHDPIREQGILARAGFSHDTVERALATEPDQAEDLVIALRRE
jgi:regulatory protein